MELESLMEVQHKRINSDHIKQEKPKLEINHPTQKDIIKTLGSVVQNNNITLDILNKEEK